MTLASGGREYCSLHSVCSDSMADVPACRIAYSRQEILNLRECCPGISRTLRRRLFFFKILDRYSCQQPHFPSKPIKVRISNRTLPKTTGNIELSPSLPASRVNLRRIPRISRRVRKQIPVSFPSLMLTNARSVLNKLDEIDCRLRRFKPSLVIITESWLNESIEDNSITFPSYRILRKDRNSQGGGILVLYSDVFSAERCSCQSFDIQDCKTQILTFYLRPSNLMVIAVYHPYWGSSVHHSTVIDCIIDIVSHAHQHHSFESLLLCGDLNGLSDSVNVLNSLLGTESVFTFPTRNDAQLDFILCDKPHFFKKVKRLSPFGLSDHAVILCLPVSLSPLPTIKKRQVRTKSAASCAKFADELKNSSSLPNILETSDVNEATDIFVSCLVSLFTKYFPLRTIRIRSDDKPWVKPSLKRLINERDKAYDKGNTAKFLRLRKAVVQHSGALKKKFFSSALQSNQPASLWRAIRKVIPRPSNTNICPDAHGLKDAFSAVFNEQSIPLFESFESLPSNPITFSLGEVLLSLKRLKNGSPGIDGLPPWLFRDHRSFLASYITHIYNLSVSSGIVPAAFKVAYVIPIPKENVNSCSNFRPISMLPVLSKVLEKLIFRKWLVPLVPQIDENQFAFVPREGQGTTVALTFIMNKILSFLDSPGAVRLLMLDFSKAFDRLPHNSILNALSSLQAPKELICWLRSFFYDRRQCVKVNNTYSEWYTANSGVPQGGVLSPLLFALAVNEIDALCDNSILVKYADDFCLLHFMRREEDDRLLEEFQHLSRRANDLGLVLNASKTKLLNFQTKKSLPELCLPPAMSDVQIVSSAKLLGLTISSNLSWKSHVSLILQRARKRLFFLRRLMDARAPEFVLWTAYCGLIRSVLSYAYPAWCNVGSGDMGALTRFEHRICKRFRVECKVRFDCFCASAAKNLAQKALASHHPLNGIFDTEATRSSSRVGKGYRKVLARTSRFKTSFISFA